MYYENFEKLCKMKGVNAYTVSKATGISTSILSSWKSGATTPKMPKLEAIAAYFGVPVTAIYGQDAEAKVELSKEDVLEHAFDDRPEMKELYELAKDAPKEDIEWLIVKFKKLQRV